MENTAPTIEDKDFAKLQELGCFKNRPFYSSSEALGLKEVSEEKLKQEPCYKTLLFIKDMLDIALNKPTKQNSFDPMSALKSEEGVTLERTLMPEDITPEQAGILFRNLERIESFYIKAIIVDVLWVSRKLKGKENRIVAEVAAEAYFNLVNYMPKPRGKLIDSHRHIHLTRYTTIMLSLKQDEKLFDKLMGLFERKEFFKIEKNGRFIVSLGNSINRIKKISPDKIKLALEKYVEIYKISNPHCSSVWDESNIWSTGVNLSNKAKNLDYESYFKEQIGNAWCDMAKLFKGNPSNGTEYLKEAILAYKNIPNKKDKVEKLKQELAEVEKKIPSNANLRIYVELKLKEPMELMAAELSGLKFEECLSKLITLCIDCLYETYDYIMKTKPESPFVNVILDKRTSYTDNGKTIHNAKPEKAVVFHNLDVLLSIIRVLIKKGLEIINKEHSFSKEEILNLIKKSSFIPDNHHKYFANGLYYFLHNEMLEAVSLLVPQIENSLRYISGSPIIVRDDLTEKEKIGIHELFESCVKKEILDEKFQFYLENIFVHPKYSLRQNIAHGEADDTIGNRRSSYCCLLLILFLVLKPTGILKIKCTESEKLLKMLNNALICGIKDLNDSLAKGMYH
ncbi:MAG: hypothetical protein LBS61_04505 [Endomicrobium sp.]|jgi:hypothetical protein|nr:hypothetical protein [Endomicrobium sp.]